MEAKMTDTTISLKLLAKIISGLSWNHQHYLFNDPETDDIVKRIIIAIWHEQDGFGG